MTNKVIAFCWHCGLPSSDQNVQSFIFDKELNKWFCSAKCLDDTMRAER